MKFTYNKGTVNHIEGNRMRKFLAILISILCLNISLVGAQNSCNIELESTILRLIQAQRAADGGDALKAVSILQGVQSEIDTAMMGCDRIRFTEQYTTAQENLAFSHPDGWGVQVLDRDVYLVATSPDIAEKFGNDIPEDLEVGEAAIALQLQPMGDDSFDDLVDEVFDDIKDQFSIIGRVEDSTFNGRRYITSSIRMSDSVSGRIAFVDYSDNEELPAAMFILGIANSDSLPIIEVYTDTLRQSIQYPPVGSLRVTGVSADSLSYSDSISIPDLDKSNSRFSYLSPDGTQLAYETSGRSGGLCVYTIANKRETCTGLPETADRPTNLYWSPDGRYVAFHQDFFRMFIESDVWLYEVETEKLVNLTDDGVEDYGFGGVEEETWLDVAITWGPDNQIYVVRIVAKPSDDSIRDAEFLLVKVDPESGEVSTAQDLTGILDPTTIYDMDNSYSLDGALSVSPDASQLAVSVAGFGDETADNGIWLIDLTGGDEPQHTVTSSDLQIGLNPAITERADNLNTRGIAWDAEGDGLFTFSRINTTIPIVIIHHVDLVTGEVIPLYDISAFTIDDLMASGDDDELPLISTLPQGVVLTPDFSGIVTVNIADDVASFSLYEFDGEFGEPTTLFEAEIDIAYGIMQIGQNGTLLYTQTLLLSE